MRRYKFVDDFKTNFFVNMDSAFIGLFWIDKNLFYQGKLIFQKFVN